MTHPVGLLLRMCCVSIAFGLPGFCASAQEDTATVNIRVVVPPLGEALAASELGAAGLWTVSSGDGALMILAPKPVEDDLSATGQSAFSIFRSDKNRFAVSLGGSVPSLRLTETQISTRRGLTRFDFMLPGKEASASSQKPQLLISAM